MKQLKPRTMAITLSIILQTLSANDKPRARDLGISFDGIPGKMNAITDVEGVKVGHSQSSRVKAGLKSEKVLSGLVLQLFYPGVTTVI